MHPKYSLEVDKGLKCYIFKNYSLKLNKVNPNYCTEQYRELWKMEFTIFEGQLRLSKPNLGKKYWSLNY